MEDEENEKNQGGLSEVTTGVELGRSETRGRRGRRCSKGRSMSGSPLGAFSDDVERSPGRWARGRGKTVACEFGTSPARGEGKCLFLISLVWYQCGGPLLLDAICRVFHPVP